MNKLAPFDHCGCTDDVTIMSFNVNGKDVT